MTDTATLPPADAPAGPVPSALPAVLGLEPHRRVFRTGPGERFVGLDPGTAVVVGSLPDGLAALVDDLATPTARDELVERAVARGARRADALDLLSRLHRAGVVVDASALRRADEHRRRAAVLVEGAGPLAVGVALGLAAAGVGTVHLRTAGTVTAADLRTGLIEADRGRPRAQALAAAVAAVAPRAVSGPAPARFSPDLVLLTDALVPEPVRVGKLHAAGRAHLAVRLRDGTGVVGPLVLPGRTACLRCLELHRRARDRAWPAVAAQLVGKPGTADPACAVATAALATAQALVALDGAAGGGLTPPTLDATLELEPSAGALRRRAWPPHPDCGCGAAGRRAAAVPGPAPGPAAPP
ncbi:TOMM precursor leader peptide-binding protein [Pseudonocardia humida]|uniref:TOMM leader peptide-binding protein n=1 Tax=Pseudonocardia humida TaxID=2800819 RepID=A0ABT1ACV0_9PSEU|nr:TOMM precursor leader peptide-binding protein [Pseudonocardia humida]MCO1660753.1 TOMM precursor leader peptide-binding protein [Pseudonocardia humida]